MVPALTESDTGALMNQQKPGADSKGGWLRFLLVAYYPFLLVLLALLGWLIYLLVRFTVTTPAGWWFSAWPLAWLGITAVQLLNVVPIWFASPADGGGSEIKLPTAFLEPIFQQGLVFSEKPLLWAEVYVGLHVFAFNIFQMYVFRRYDFVSMYLFRLVYYIHWHIVWGYVRLQLLF